jgi:transposase-like protein
VDEDGVVLDILVQDRRQAKAVKRFFKRLLKGLQYVPRVIVTDKLRGYGVAKRQILPNVEHRQSRYLNNRAEKSHRPTRRRERQMQRFKSPKQARTSSPHTHSSTATSIHADTEWRLQPTARSAPRRSMSGGRTRAPSARHDMRCLNVLRSTQSTPS